MILWGFISFVLLGNLFFIYRCFKSKIVKDNILFQTMPSLLFWVTVIVSSLVARSLFSPSDVVSFGTDLIILGSIITIISTFAMGVRGAITCLNERNGFYMTSSILSLMMIVLPIALILFPFLAMHLLILKQYDKQTKKQLEKRKKKAERRAKKNAKKNAKRK